MNNEIVETAHAKVNLWLEVLGRRSDGYHELETLMHEISLDDQLVLKKRSTGQRLSIEGADLAVDEDNLVLKALRALEAEVGRSLPVSMRLIKRIPMGGGLGGGSSDAAALLRGMNELYELDLSPETLEEVAARFGSDTAFFVRGATSFCRGRGEQIEPYADAGRYCFLLVFPGLHVPTPGVFRALRLTGAFREPYHLLAALRGRDPGKIREELFNRLEEPARLIHPKLEEILAKLAEDGFLLSGSGSTIFRLCDDESEAQDLSERISSAWKLETQIAFSAGR